MFSCSCHFINIYCGSSDCYELLGVSRVATKTELKRAYKAKYKAHGSENDKIKTAYKVLSDMDTRKHYDYMLANPNQRLYNYYQYFKFVASPKVAHQVLLVFGIVVISLVQYLYKSHSYWSAVRNGLKNPKNRSKALHKVQEQYLLSEDNITSKKLTNKEKKERRKKEEDKALRKIVLQSIKSRKPEWRDTLFVQLLFSPYFFLLHLRRLTNWLSRFDFFKEEYEELKPLKKGKGKKVETWTRPSSNDLKDLSDCEDSHSRTDAWLKSNID